MTKKILIQPPNQKLSSLEDIATSFGGINENQMDSAQILLNNFIGVANDMCRDLHGSCYINKEGCSDLFDRLLQINSDLGSSLNDMNRSLFFSKEEPQNSMRNFIDLVPRIRH